MNSYGDTEECPECGGSGVTEHDEIEGDLSCRTCSGYGFVPKPPPERA